MSDYVFSTAFSFMILRDIDFCNAVEYLKWWVLEAWDSCSHKKIVAASAVTAFWNLSTIKTRIFTGNSLTQESYVTMS